ncbi:MAG: hypothetical protein LRY71_11210 [Bacillaceae bacterium]|nr:hypothetical protein [Bacillaceae bacterium]
MWYVVRGNKLKFTSCANDETYEQEVVFTNREEAIQFKNYMETIFTDERLSILKVIETERG